MKASVAFAAKLISPNIRPRTREGAIQASKKRAKIRGDAQLVALTLPRAILDAARAKRPTVVTMIRRSPRPFDTDNTVGALKQVRDAVSDMFGWPDNAPHLTWLYRWEKQSKREDVVIEVEVPGV